MHPLLQAYVLIGIAVVIWSTPDVLSYFNRTPVSKSGRRGLVAALFIGWPIYLGYVLLNKIKAGVK